MLQAGTAHSMFFKNLPLPVFYMSVRSHSHCLQTLQKHKLRTDNENILSIRYIVIYASNMHNVGRILTKNLIGKTYLSGCA